MLSKESRNLFIGSLNCRGLAKDIEYLKINILAVQETKIKGEEKTDQIQPENGVWTENTWNTIRGSESTKRYMFFKGKCNNSFHGVGFITKSNLNKISKLFKQACTSNSVC